MEHSIHREDGAITEKNSYGNDPNPPKDKNQGGTSTTDVLVDVTGYVPAGSPLVPVVPTRYLDTRGAGSTFDDQFGTTEHIDPGGWVHVQVAGRGSVPSGVAAVVVNVTAVGPEDAGFATVFPCGDSAPNASTLNYQPGEDIANAAVIPVDAEGFVCVTTSASANYLLDVNGYIPAGSGVESLVPARLLDTRSGGQTIDMLAAGAGTVQATAVTRVQIAGRGGVPTGARTAVVNVTAVGPAAAGYATVFPCGDVPNASNLNYRPGEDIPNAVITRLDADGGVCIHTDAAADYLLDVTGFLTP